MVCVSDNRCDSEIHLWKMFGLKFVFHLSCPLLADLNGGGVSWLHANFF